MRKITSLPKKPILLSLLLLIVLSALAQDTFKPYPLAELREDYQALRDSLEKHHQALYLFDTRENWDSFFESTYHALRDGMSELEFYRVITQTLVRVRDKHINLSPFYTGERLSDIANKSDQKLFPLILTFLKGEAYIYANGSPDSSITQGVKVVSINGRPMSGIIRDILPNVIASGSIQSGKYKELGRWFDTYYYLFIEQVESFQIECRDPDGNPVHYEMAAVSFSEKMKWYTHYYADRMAEVRKRQEKYLDFRENGKIAIVKVRSFDDEQMDIKAIFKAIDKQGSSAIIVDLRNNIGGDLLRAVTFFDKISKVREQTHLLTARTSQGFGAEASISRSKKKQFERDVYVLTNGRTFSAAAAVTTWAKSYANAIVVGEETAGKSSEASASPFLQFNLPHTGIGIQIPTGLVTFHVEAGEKGRGIIPDHEITPGIDDFYFNQDVDAALDFTLELINNQSY